MKKVVLGLIILLSLVSMVYSYNYDFRDDFDDNLLDRNIWNVGLITNSPETCIGRYNEQGEFLNLYLKETSGALTTECGSQVRLLESYSGNFEVELKFDNFQRTGINGYNRIKIDFENEFWMSISRDRDCDYNCNEDYLIIKYPGGEGLNGPRNQVWHEENSELSGIFKIIRIDNQVEFYFNNILKYTADISSYITGDEKYFVNFGVSALGDETNVDIDYISLSGNIPITPNQCSSPEQIILRLSDYTNAHAEVWNGAGNYPVEICYDKIFGVPGDGDRTCIDNKMILGLSETTNAHAEIPESPEYTTKVCYDNLLCFTRNNNCYTDEECIVTLSDNTNAHLATCDSSAPYDTKICCSPGEGCTDECSAGEIGCEDINTRYNCVMQSDGCYDKISTDCGAEETCLNGVCISEPVVFWSKNGETKIENLEVHIGTTSVLMVLKNSGLAQGTNVGFEIYENDWPLPRENIRVGENAINGTVDSNGNVMVSWTPTNEDIEKAKDSFLEGDEYEFYFEVNGEESDELIVTIVEVDPCLNILSCGDYEGEVNCTGDDCGVAEGSDPECGEITPIPGETECWHVMNCSCEWNGTDCNFVKENVLVGESEGDADYPKNTGSCVTTDTTTDNCDDEILEQTWISVMDWKDNVYDKNRMEASGISLDQFINETTNAGIIYHNVSSEGSSIRNIFEGCVSGSRIIPCPAQIKLDFFGFYNFIITFTLIWMVYFIHKKRFIK